MKNKFSITTSYVPDYQEEELAKSIMTPEQEEQSKQRALSMQDDFDKFYKKYANLLSEKEIENYCAVNGMDRDDYEDEICHETEEEQNKEFIENKFSYKTNFDRMKNNTERILSAIEGLDDNVLIKINTYRTEIARNLNLPYYGNGYRYGYTSQEIVVTVAEIKDFLSGNEDYLKLAYSNTHFKYELPEKYQDNFFDFDDEKDGSPSMATIRETDRELLLDETKNDFLKIEIEILGKIPETIEEFDEIIAEIEVVEDTAYRRKSSAEMDLYKYLTPNIKEYKLFHNDSAITSKNSYKILPNGKVIFYSVDHYHDPYPSHEYAIILNSEEAMQKVQQIIDEKNESIEETKNDISQLESIYESINQINNKL